MVVRGARFLASPSVISALPSCCLQHRQCERPRVRLTRVPLPDSQLRADVRSIPRLGLTKCERREAFGIFWTCNESAARAGAHLHVPEQLAHGRDCTSPDEQLSSLRDELLDGLRGSAGDVLDRGGHAVIPILAV
jgi:hypothetical protein